MAKTKAQEWDDKIDAGKEAEGLTPVRARTKGSLDNIVSVRFSRNELALLTMAATEKETRPSTFIHDAAMVAAGQALLGLDSKDVDVAVVMAELDVVTKRVHELLRQR